VSKRRVKKYNRRHKVPPKVLYRRLLGKAPWCLLGAYKAPRITLMSAWRTAIAKDDVQNEFVAKIR